jgi:hypothetical protein
MHLKDLPENYNMMIFNCRGKISQTNFPILQFCGKYTSINMAM